MPSNSHAIGLVVSLAAIATTLQFRSVAQTGLPDIYAETPVAVVPSETIAAFPVNTFLENLVVAPTGNL